MTIRNRWKKRLALSRGLLMTALVAALVLPMNLMSGQAHAASDYQTSLVAGKTVRWSPCQTAITYKVNVRMAGKKKARRKARREIKKAFRELRRATGLPFVYRRGSKRVPTGSGWHRRQGRNAEIVVAYVKRSSAEYSSSLLPARAWSVGGVLYRMWGSPTRAAIGRGYVLIDSDRIRGMRRGFGAGSSSGNLILHELGHVVGLKHVSSRQQLMHPVISGRTPRGYSRGDRAGLARVGARAGCIKIPKYVFSSS